jgi:DUF4097 and DUF4098 domain-containing protein YvlB
MISSWRNERPTLIELREILMNKLLITILACLLAVTAQAKEIDRKIDAAKDGHVDISNIAGSVTVSVWSRNTVAVTGTLGRDVKELIVERSGDKVRIKVKVPRHSGRGINSDLYVKIPVNSSLDVGTVSANVDVTGVIGEQGLASVSGNVTTEFSGADLSLESVSGRVEVAGKRGSGEIEANSVSGNVTLRDVSGEVVAESVSGNVRLIEGSFEEAELGTVSGKIYFEGTLQKGGDLSAETVSGSVEVQLVGEVSAKIEIETFSGGIRNCFGPKAERTSKYAPGWELEFIAGGGEGDIEISTLSGGVRLCKK